MASNNYLEEEEEEEGGVDDWCLVCKDGGELLLCEFPECERAYHYKCAGESKTNLSGLAKWQCRRHSCLSCNRTPTVALCYSCPSASCSKCLDALGFVRIHDKYGFCPKCFELAMYLEGLSKTKPIMEDSSCKYRHFKEYYRIIKEKYDVTVDDVKKGRAKQREMKSRGGHKEMKGREKRKYWSLDKSDEDKEFRKMKLNTAGTSQNEVLTRDMMNRIPALTPDNVQRIYLTRTVIQKLLMEPDLFEEKVRRTFVGIELPRKARSNKTTRQLVQVTGITKTSLENGQICIKLQAKNRQDDISVDMVSDMDFQKYLCDDIRQQVKDGLIEMPDVYIVRETRKLQQNMNRAHERGHKQEFMLLAQKKKDLQTSNSKLQLIRYFQRVEVEEILADTKSGNVVNVTLQNEQVLKADPNSVISSENNMIDSVESSSHTLAQRPIANDIMDDKKQKESAPKLIPGSWELKRERISVGSGSKQHGMKFIDIESRHQPMVDDDKQDVDAAGDQAQEIVSNNVADDVIILADDTIYDKKQKDSTSKFITGSLELKRERNSVGSGSKQHGMKFIDIESRHQPMVDDDKQVVDAASDQAPNNAADDVIILADHSSGQSFGVENDCDGLLLSWDVLEEQKRVDVMLEEFENNAHVVKDTHQLELPRIEGFSVEERLASLEQKVVRILNRG